MGSVAQRIREQRRSQSETESLSHTTNLAPLSDSTEALDNKHPSSSASHPDAEFAIDDIQIDLQFPPLEPNGERKLPDPTRLRTFKRLLSRQGRVSPCNPRLVQEYL
ncbi:hypothetical protein SDJN03_00021, partial [Cucurbita argyrosperma subsp. sororia]